MLLRGLVILLIVALQSTMMSSFHVFKRSLAVGLRRNYKNGNTAEMSFVVRGIERQTIRSANIMTRLLSTKKGSDDPTPKKTKKAPIVKVSDLTIETATAELNALNTAINHHDQLYYDKNEPEITDAAYDKLIRRASDIVGRFNALRGIVSKLDSVGVSLKGNSRFPPFKHTKRMQSLDNAFNEAEVASFLNKINKGLNNSNSHTSSTSTSLIIEPKIDGLSLALHYINGELLRAGTRGDGTTGEDVTLTVKESIPDIPLRVNTPLPFLEVRGEVYISKSDFDALNANRRLKGLSEFSTARNAASGGLRRIKTNDSNDAEGVDDRRLKFFAYSILSDNNNINGSDSRGGGDGMLPDSQSDGLKLLTSLGFKVASPIESITTDNSEAVFDKCKLLEAQSRHWPFVADGVVLKVNSFSSQQLLGEGSKAPKWAVAFKFNGDTVSTVLEDITLQVGRTGVITPVAVLKPVSIGGVRVERATLHNFNEVRRLGLYAGAIVMLKRSGDVIPKILGLLQEEGIDRGSEEKVFEVPSVCPVCGSAVIGDVNGTLRCSGGVALCSAQAVEQIRHFCSRDAANIEGLGGSKLEYLLKNGHIRNILDLFLLRNADMKTNNNNNTDNSDSGSSGGVTLRGAKGWGDRSVNNLLSSIDEAANNITMTSDVSRLLYGLGVSQVGLQTARDISELFDHNFDAFWSYLRSEATTSSTAVRGEKLLSIDGLGPVALNALLLFALDENNHDMVRGLIRVLPAASVSQKQTKQSNNSSSSDVKLPLLGRCVVFTGSFEDGTTRAEASKVCESLGGSTHNSVTKAVNLLVDCFKEGSKKSEKHLKAEKLGIEIWNEEKWNRFIKQQKR